MGHEYKLNKDGMIIEAVFNGDPEQRKTGVFDEIHRM
jgi:hypothetical protein